MMIDFSNQITRRSFIILTSALCAWPQSSLANDAREITWDDLLPKGVPYAEIIGEGELDEENDTWNPVYDENATKLNTNLNGLFIKLPGYIIPFESNDEGVTDFMLVPYVGACIHTPPPPANQLVFVTTKKPWPSDKLWDPVMVSGIMQAELNDTDLGQTGYELTAQKIDVYQIPDEG